MSSAASETDIQNAIMAIRRNRVALKGNSGSFPHIIIKIGVAKTQNGDLTLSVLMERLERAIVRMEHRDRIVLLEI